MLDRGFGYQSRCIRRYRAGNWHEGWYWLIVLRWLCSGFEQRGYHPLQLQEQLMTSCSTKSRKVVALSWIAGCTVRDGSKAVGNKYPITATRENSFLTLSFSLRASLFNHGCGAHLSYYTRYSCALTATLKGWGIKFNFVDRETTDRDGKLGETGKKERKLTWNAAHSSGVFLHR